MRFLTMIKFYITSTFSKRSIFAVTAIMLLLILSLSNGLAFFGFRPTEFHDYAGDLPRSALILDRLGGRYHSSLLTLHGVLD